MGNTVIQRIVSYKGVSGTNGVDTTETGSDKEKVQQYSSVSNAAETKHKERSRKFRASQRRIPQRTIYGFQQKLIKQLIKEEETF